MAQFLNYKVGSFPCSYLGLPIGANPKRLKTWQPVIQKMQRRLSKWSGDDEHRKLAWVSWDEVCNKHLGGLGLRDLRAFNLAFLGKWRWRLLVERETYWNRVVTSIYVVSALRKEGMRVTGSRWWLDLWSIEEGANVSWDWRETLLFWRESWCTSTPFCDRYSRLFTITTTKDISVSNMFVHREGGFGWNWSWRRSLFQWELSQLSLLLLDLSMIQLHDNIDDTWCWKVDFEGFYSVKSSYHAIINDSIYAEIPLHKFIWCRLVPSKVSCFAWKVMLDRIPSKVNLAKRNVIPNSVVGYV
uniref:Ribonuclease H protein At1g65750 family n=1 Tax=Cajanus cajan TaxID=3821 RepID=A0A151S512_CAJCA|nr:Putative ribonuclease H protein At1g65750 family [Cajanus cajan]